MTEGKGYCARRQEYNQLKELDEFIKNSNKIIVYPDIQRRIRVKKE